MVGSREAALATMRQPHCSLFPCWFALALLAAHVSAAAARADAAVVPELDLHWTVVANLGQEFEAQLRIANAGARPLVDKNWRLYFNSVRTLRLAESCREAALRHVSGDLYELRPTDQFPPLPRGGNCELAFRGDAWAIKESDCPIGFYVAVSQGHHDATASARSYTIASFDDPRQTKRNADDALPTPTAAIRLADDAPQTLVELTSAELIVPTPLRLTPTRGVVTLDASTVITYQPGLEATAALFAQQLQDSLGMRPPTRPGILAGAHAIRLRLSPADVKGFSGDSPEAYLLDISPEAGVDVVGASAAGVFYGTQSLRALLPRGAGESVVASVAIPAMRVQDVPRFSYRGLHLDVARNFHSLASVKKLLEIMAFYKLNRFHWHLTDDEGWRLEIAAYPELTEVGARRGHTRDEADRLLPSLGSGPLADPSVSPGTGFYSQADFIEVLRFAHERRIEVIPELDFPGHARAAIKAMAARSARLARAGRQAEAAACLLTDPADRSEYESVQLYRDNVVDVGLEATYEFLDTVVGEIVDLYGQAGVPLTTIHIGGDEVPKGAWQASPACQRLAAAGETKGADVKAFHAYFVRRMIDVLAKHRARPAGWEECVLENSSPLGEAKAPDRGLLDHKIVAYVWNNVWGWGQEDVAYKLANAGFDVVLCNATNLYFDMASDKDPQEPGYYWAAFVDARDVFEFNPLDLYQNARQNNMGQAIPPANYARSTTLDAEARGRILGIQGQLWSELLTSPERLEYMAFPRLIVLAERAWAAAPAWASLDDDEQRLRAAESDWNRFANRLGQRELPRLDRLAGGVNYRLPPPGAAIENGKLVASTAYPGLDIRYTTDGSEPTTRSRRYAGAVSTVGGARLKTFDARGRSSRTTMVTP